LGEVHRVYYHGKERDIPVPIQGKGPICPTGRKNNYLAGIGHCYHFVKYFLIFRVDSANLDDSGKQYGCSDRWKQTSFFGYQSPRSAACPRNEQEELNVPAD
jgi:hypothetical protein